MCAMTSQNSKERASAPGGRQGTPGKVPYNLIELMVWCAYGLISPTHIFAHFHMTKSTSWLQRGSPASGVITCTECQNLQKWCQQLGKLPRVTVEQSFKECYVAKVLMEQNVILCGKTRYQDWASKSESNEWRPMCTGLSEASDLESHYWNKWQEVAGSLSCEL